MKKILTLGILLFGIALFIRTIAISSLPRSLNWDEATFAYNAYSLLETGKDEYGQPLPLQFKSIGDYKNPMYIYLLVPTIKVFGLTELATRIPPAVLGALTVVVLFILVYSLSGNLKLGVTSGLVLAISPWHIQFTRAGADVGVSSFFIVLGICLFVRKRFVTSVAALVGASYSYYADKFFGPLILIALGALYLPELKKNFKTVGLAIVVGIILTLPILGLQFSAGHTNKVNITTLLSYNFPQEYLKQTLREDGPILNVLFHNPLIEYGSLFVDRYLNHFSPSFLFLQGLEDNRQRLESMGMLYLTDAVFIVIALCTLPRWGKKKFIWLVFLWLLLAPLPAAITKAPVHARRAINMVYPLSILIAAGILEMKFKWRLVMVPAVLGCITLYLLSYVVFTPLTTFRGSAGWQYGYKQIVATVTPLAKNYDQVIVDTSYQGPYIYFLFYQKYPPAKYQPQANLYFTDPTGLGESAGFDNYHFRSIYWPGDRGTKNTLFVGPPESLPLKDIDPKKAKLIGTTFFPDGTEAWRLVATLPQ